ncbi:hypothetical protein PGT21_001276 [Puccinia graminis f. sp. tritici]|uniref:Uncharacterized protein n=1 Tax=Puccinia graminis f. sp. tritici TaxID=56615 RepID=A0A5B0NIK3_PUCGR|nr:hypothetical protein PGT21_001276 [Puccinia graminis f. sp. tritici]
MAPPPQVVVVVKNEGGKEIGGGNHYCTICRTPALPTPPGPLASAHLLVHVGRALTPRFGKPQVRLLLLTFHVGRALTPRFGKPQFLGPLGYEPRGALTAISI